MRFLSMLVARAPRRDYVPGYVLDEETGSIAYDPALVGQLKQGHRDLMEALAALKTASEASRCDELPRLLLDFQRAFQAHMTAENAKLYVYVQQRHGTDTATSDLVFGVRREMHGIARLLVKFINTHTTTAPTADTLQTFRAELDLIGSLLLRRVHVVESRLYHLYRPA